jgi:hypothetical protein
MAANKVTKASVKEAPLMVNTITVRPTLRQTSDIETWRSALKSADVNRRSKLYNLYEDLLLDNILSDAIEKRIQAITNAEITFTDKSGNPSEEIDALMQSEGWEEILHLIMRSKFWGFSLFQTEIAPTVLASLIPNKNVNPIRTLILTDESSDTGYDYSTDDRFIFAGSKSDFGLILKAAPYVIYKRGNFGDWAQFAELFGMPFRKGKYNNYDEATRIALENALLQMGSAPYIVIPKDGDIEFVENKSSSDGELYNKLRTACNEEILIGILGQTMTTLNGSSRSQSETHMEVQQDKHKSDRRFVQRILNTQFLTLLQNRGFNVEGGKFNFIEKGESVSLIDQITIDEKLNALIPIPKAYFYDRYGIPMPAKGEEVANNATVKEPTTTTVTPVPNTKPTDKKLVQEDDGMMKKLFSFFADALSTKRAPLKF